MYKRFKEKQTSVDSAKEIVPQQSLKLTLEKNVDKESHLDLTLKGRINLEFPTPAKIVRIFTSSTFTDTKEERNALMERVYPKLKDFCHGLGYEFQVVDMRWGVRDEAADDQKTTDLCLKEVENCKTLSTGPSFVTFLSHKYGYRPFPSVLSCDEFEKLLEYIQDEEDVALIEIWFKKDNNAIPPAYVIQPVSAVYPDFLNYDQPEKKNKAKDAFWNDSERLQSAFLKAAKEVLSPEECAKFSVSVTETEIRHGLLEDDKANDHCLWFKRDIVDIEQEAQTRMLTRFYECKGSSTEVVEEARALLKELKEKKIPDKLSQENIIGYSVPWHPNGIDPLNEPIHAEYLNRFCRDFEEQIQAKILAGIQQREERQVSNPLYDEVMQHSAFCQQKCATFYGREDILEQIKEYVQGPSTQPLVVHGSSGSGKTSIMAAVVHSVIGWCDEKVVVIHRFLGTTQESANIFNVINSIVDQMRIIYKQKREPPAEFQKLVTFFHLMLKLAKLHFKAQGPLVIVLDSIDQLDPDFGARQCAWLPNALPEHVKLIVSTLPEEKYEVMPCLRLRITEPANILAVPSLSPITVRYIMTSWLSANGRTLTPGQMEVIVRTFIKCPLPLYLKLCYDEAVLWKSYTALDSCGLADNIRDMISIRLTRVEREHGWVLVSRALGYITLSRAGLSEAELEDLLSMDDDVLNDTYQYSEPPIRRLPPLLLARVKDEINEYLVERGNERVRVLNWYHRQFIEAAYDRYCSDAELKRKMHATIADYFRGVWADQPKPYMDRKGKAGAALRHLAPQPNKYDQQFNYRKLMELPHQLTLAGELDLLKSECLFNFDFMQAKIAAKSVRHLLDDFEFAMNTFPEELRDLHILEETLQLSNDALRYDPYLFPGQIHGRIWKPQKGNLKTLTDQCLSNSWRPVYICNEPILSQPGGQLVQSLSEHTKLVTWVDMSADGKTVLTCSHDKSVKLWDVTKGVLLKSYNSIDTELQKVKFAVHDQYAVVAGDKFFSIIRLGTGEIVHQLAPKSEKTRNNISEHFVVLSDTVHFIAVKGQSLFQYRVETGALVQTIEDIALATAVPDTEADYDGITAIGARQKYAALVSPSLGSCIRLFDLEKGVFVSSVEVFAPPKTDDDDELTVESIEMTRDEQRVVYANYMDNDVHIRSLPDFQPLGIIPGNRNWFTDKFLLLPDDHTLLGKSNKEVILWNIGDGTPGEELNARSIIEHTCSLECAAAINVDRIVAVASDNCVRVWDLTRPLATLLYSNTKDTGLDAFAVGKEKFKKILWRQLLALDEEPRYLLCHGALEFENKSDERKRNFVGVFDVKSETYVRQAIFKSTQSIDIIVKDSKTVVFDDDRCLHLFSLETMELIRTFPGFFGPYTSDIYIVHSRNELYTSSRGMKNIKVFDIETGTVKRFLKNICGDKRVDNFKLSKDGTVGVATDDDAEKLIIFDAVSGEVRCSLSSKNACFSVTEVQFVCDNRRIITTLDIKVAKETVTGLALFSIEADFVGETRCLVKTIDTAMYKVYKTTKDPDKTVDVMETTMLSEDLVMTLHSDNIVRVWDTNEVKLVKRLIGHKSDPGDFHLPIGFRPDASLQKPARFVTANKSDDELAFRLWNTETWEGVASCKMDIEALRFVCLYDGQIVLGFYGTSRYPVFWRLVEDPLDKHSIQQTDLYEPSDEEPIIVEVPTSPSGYPRLSDDPDSDVDIVESEDEDSDADDVNVDDDDDDDN